LVVELLDLRVGVAATGAPVAQPGQQSGGVRRTGTPSRLVHRGVHLLGGTLPGRTHTSPWKRGIRSWDVGKRAEKAAHPGRRPYRGRGCPTGPPIRRRRYDIAHPDTVPPAPPRPDEPGTTRPCS